MGVTDVCGRPERAVSKACPRHTMVGPLPPKTVAPPLGRSITPRRGAQGLHGNCMEAGKAGLLPQALGSSPHIPPTMARTVNKHRSIHPFSYSQQWLSASLIYLSVCPSLSLSISPWAHYLSTIRLSIFSLFFLYNKLQGRGCVTNRDSGAHPGTVKQGVHAA